MPSLIAKMRIFRKVRTMLLFESQMTYTTLPCDQETAVQTEFVMTFTLVRRNPLTYPSGSLPLSKDLPYDQLES